MRILIISHFSDFEQQEDASILHMRGYEVVTYHDLHTARYEHNNGKIPSDRIVRMHVALELIAGSIPVLHPNADAPLVHFVAGLCNTFTVPLLRLEDLPAMPPKSLEVIDSLNIADSCFRRYEKQQPALEVPLLKRAVSLRERWTVLQKRVLRWEQHFNARYGDLLKNPQSRRAHEAARCAAAQAYSEPTTISTTG